MWYSLQAAIELGSYTDISRSVVHDWALGYNSMMS